MFRNSLRALCFAILSLCFSYAYTNEETEVSGNLNPNYNPSEYGKASDNEGGDIPPHHPLAAHNYQFMCSAAYTYWAVYQEGLIVAVSNNPAAASSSLDPGNTIIPYNPEKSGFKVSAFMQLDYDKWQVGLDYTWFNNQNKLSTKGFKIVNIYSSPWIEATHIDLPDIASSFSNQFNRLEAVMQRSIEFSERLVMTPRIAVLGAWEDQQFNADFDVQKSLSDIDLLFMRNHQYWYGMGPLAGTKVSYNFHKYLSFNLATDLAIVYSKHSVRLDQKEAEIASPNSRSVIQNMKYNWWNSEPMVDAKMGLCMLYPAKNMTFSLEAAWELQTWFFHNGFLPERNMIGGNGNLSMQGLTLTGQIIF